MIFRKLGGSYQYWVSRPEDLPEVLRLDPALWAALSVPASALNADRKFVSYLDFDANGMIRLEDVEHAIKTMQAALRDLKPLADPAPEIPLSALNDQEGDCRARLDFIAARPELAENGILLLANVSAKLQEVSSGALRGDGILRAPAVAGSGAETLFNEVLATNGGEGISAAQLDKFIADANDFLAWAKQTERPKFRDADPAPYYAALTAVREKVDEFFRFCELLRLDPAHEKRFRLDPENLPPLDIKDSDAVAETLFSAPLATPNRAAELDLTGELNPGYREALQSFAKLFAVEKLTPESWAALQAELTSYVEYLGRAQGDNIGRLGEAKLTACLADAQPDKLHELFVRDGKVGGVLGQLRMLEKIILFKQYLWPFINNFVCFKALFTANETSMIQAGRLIMDGRTFELTLWIDSIAAHKVIAVRSHLCLIYLELVTETGEKRYVATAVTGGDLKRIYVGKPAFFIDSKGKQYNGRIVDLVYGPISFWQTVLEPFRRLGAAISSKSQKLTDYSSTEKAMTEKIDSTSDKLTTPKGGKPGAPAAAKPAAPAAADQQQAKSGGVLGKGNTTMLLLAGGLSLAALGAALSYLVSTIASVVSSMMAMPPMKLLQLVLTILLILFAPLALYAILQLRKRNLTLFLEAAGWAINLPMKLNSRVSNFFTYFGIYPEDAKFKALALELRNQREDRFRRRRRRIRNTIIIVIILLLVGGHYWKTGKIQRIYNSIKIRCSAKRGKSCSVKCQKPAEKTCEKPSCKTEDKSNVDENKAKNQQNDGGKKAEGKSNDGGNGKDRTPAEGKGKNAEGKSGGGKNGSAEGIKTPPPPGKTDTSKQKAPVKDPDAAKPSAQAAQPNAAAGQKPAEVKSKTSEKPTK